MSPLSHASHAAGKPTDFLKVTSPNASIAPDCIQNRVGETGFEPAAPLTPFRCATRLRHSPTRSLLYGGATVSLRRGLLSDARRTGAVRAMVADPQEHAPARRHRSNPPIPGITRARFPERTSSACSAAGSRAGTALADDLDLGGSSAQGLVSQGSGPRRQVAAATP